jgi:hypothetical protein
MEILRISLKGYSSTRWSARKEAVSSMFLQIENVFKVLTEISTDSNLNAETVSGAKDLIKQIDFIFICLLNLWCQILSLIDRENKCLQSKNISVDIASKKLGGLVTSIQYMRDQGIDDIISAAKVMATKIGIHPDFAEKRKRKAKRVTLEEAEDESHLLTPASDFQRQSNAVFDSILTQLQWRSF